MAAAIPLVVGMAAGTGAYMAGLSATWVMTIGVGAMMITSMIMGAGQSQKMHTADYAIQEVNPRADNTPLPRFWGTVRVPPQLVWFGNKYYKETKQSKANSRTY